MIYKITFMEGSKLVQLTIVEMAAKGADLVVLEAEVTNNGALALYEKLNFVRSIFLSFFEFNGTDSLRDKRLSRYYLNGNDAFRLKLFLKPLIVFVSIS